MLEWSRADLSNLGDDMKFEGGTKFPSELMLSLLLELLRKPPSSKQSVFSFGLFGFNILENLLCHTGVFSKKLSRKWIHGKSDELDLSDRDELLESSDLI